MLVLATAIGSRSLSAQDTRPATATLEVTLVGIRPAQGGELLVQLYDRPTAWLQLDSARAVQRLPLTGDSAIAIFDGLPFDTGYAIAVVHDRNGNGKLDMRWFPFPKPKEGAGVSRNHTRMGKPKYQDATFSLEHEVERQRVELRY